MTYLGSDRFIVRELEGYWQQGDGRALASHVLPGLTCVVLDRAYCYQLLGAFYTEDLPRGGVRWPRERRAAVTRERAAALALELNGA